MRSQELIHWLEHGTGVRWLARALLGLGLLALSAGVAFKQFRGPGSEETLRQLVLARAVAEGRGFSADVRYPQAVATLEARGHRFDERAPELYSAPGYAAAVGALLWALPDDRKAALFAHTPEPPNGWATDYAVLAFNVVLLWLAAGLTWRLGCRWFDPVVGLIAAVALLFSVATWQRVVALDGTAWAMVLLLLLVQLTGRAIAAPRKGWVAGAGGGLVLGLLYLTDYPYVVLLPVLLAFASWQRRPWVALALFVGFVIIALPWSVRNVKLIDHPVGLAAQELGLRAGDPTADPAAVRSRWEAAPPPVSLNKVANKALTGAQNLLLHDLWARGGGVLTAFFVAGCLYRFRNDEVQRQRLLVLVGLFAVSLAQAAANAGEGERLAVGVFAPLIMILGAGFFRVLLSSSATFRDRMGWPVAALLVLQAWPLVPDLLEPRQAHFRYPPYYPSLFRNLQQRVVGMDGSARWMADVPAGAAWYGGAQVWAQPATVREFHLIDAEFGVSALVLTPHTLERPRFADLRPRRDGGRWGDWGDLYRAILLDTTPANWPLTQTQRVADDLVVQLNPSRLRASGK